MEITFKEVRYDKWCPKCKHWPNKFGDKGVTAEFQHPCGECLEASNAMQDGTEKPVYWKEK